MERKKNLKIRKEIIFIYLIFSVGVFGHLFMPLRDLMLMLTPFTLLLTGVVVFYYSIADDGKQIIGWGIVTYIITFFLEAIGVYSGIIFGNYKYGSTLGFSLFNVPLIIGFNWVLVILGAISISMKFSSNIFLVTAFAAFLAVLFDFVLEPVAIKLDYWNWQNNIIPIQNYIAWFIIAFFASIFFLKLRIKLKTNISSHYFFVQLIFFIILSTFIR